MLEQSDITDTGHYIAEDHLWAFLKATPSGALEKRSGDYGERVACFANSGT